MPSAVDSNLKKGIALLKQGNVFNALLDFHQIRPHYTLLSAEDQKLLFQNYNLALNILLDRYIAAARESMENDNEINTAIIFFIILNFYSDLRYTVHKDVTYDADIVESLAYEYEKWILKIIEKTSESNFSFRKFQNKYEETFTSFSISIGLYHQAVLPLLKDLAKKPKLFQKIQKYTIEVGKNFIEFYINLGENFVKNNNLIRSKETLKKINRIYNYINDPKVHKKNIFQFQTKVMELAADCEIDAGLNYRKSNSYETSIQHLKIAFVQFRDLNLPRKQKIAKDEYLNTCILSAKFDLEHALEFSNKGENEDALFHYQQAIEKLTKINAKKVLQQAIGQLSKHYESIGDSKFEQGKLLMTEDLEDLRRSGNFFDEAKDFYYKAKQMKKEKECERYLVKIHKKRYKMLELQQAKFKNTNNFEREFLTLEELHYLCYKMEDQTNAQKYARRMERIKSKINFNVLDHLKTENLKQKPWLESFEDESIKNDVTEFIFSKPTENSDDLPNIFNSSPPETTPFFDPVNDQTFVMKQPENPNVIPQFRKLKRPSGLSQNKALSNQEIKRIYQIIKKFNQKQYLLNDEVQFLLAYGINLPQDGSYYYKFPDSKHQFYVHQSQSGIPFVLMVPTSFMIAKQNHLGTLAARVDVFIPNENQEEKKIFTTTDILKSHINLALNHSQWSRIIEGFQYSTLADYFYFLHAVRLFDKKAAPGEISRYLNSSVIAEFMNIESDKLEFYLKEFPNVYFLEQINLWSKNINFRLFFGGLLYLRNKNYDMAALLWNMLEIS